MLEPSVRAERAEERLLERVVGAIDAETSAQKAEHLGPMLVVEALERGDRHGFHHPGQTRPGRRFVSMRGMRAAVVGHVEWLEFVPVEAVPRPGEIVHADESWEQAAGGGSVAAVQLTKLADSVDFFTALGNDEHARLAREELEARGITVHATAVDAPQRSGFTFVDDAGERTITTIGRKLHPRGHDDALPWHELARCDAVYFCAGDADALLRARRARVLVATARELSTLRQASVELDALVSSGEGRGRALPPRADRSGAAARRDDVRARSAAGRSRVGRTTPRRFRRIPPTRTAPATASRRASHSRWLRGSRGSTRSTSPPAAAPVRSPGPASTRRWCRCRRDVGAGVA